MPAGSPFLYIAAKEILILVCCALRLFWMFGSGTQAMPNRMHPQQQHVCCMNAKGML